MNKTKLKKIEEKVINKVEDKILALHVFDEPRPNYISKITATDKFFADTILRFIPVSVRPNFITVFRFISIPFIIFFLLHEDYQVAFWLFVISALSDAIDGALARTRNQITDWGIVFDPFADKLLISSVSLVVISKLVSPYLAGAVVFIEIMLIFSSYARFRGEIVPAKTVGKIKMILQSVGVSFLLLSLIVDFPIFIVVGTYILYVSIVFGLLSLFVYRSI